MKKIALLAVVATLSQFANAASDLTLTGEKWIATYTGFVCAAFTPVVQAPAALADLNVKFEQLTSDSTLDNALLKATFVQNGKTCRYNAIILADNTAQSSQLVQSIAYDVNATNGAEYQDCKAGKETLDAAFKATPYLYYGHPHNLAFMLPASVGVESVCGAGATTIGVNFVVSGTIKPPVAK